jgi:hypothetical protein
MALASGIIEVKSITHTVRLGHVASVIVNADESAV